MTQSHLSLNADSSISNFCKMGNYNCVCACKGEFDWPLDRKAESVNMKTAGNAALKDLDPSSLDASDNVSIASKNIPNMKSRDVPFSQQATNKHGDEDKPGTKELTDADDKSQASVGSIKTAEEEDPKNIITAEEDDPKT